MTSDSESTRTGWEPIRPTHLEEPGRCQSRDHDGGDATMEKARQGRVQTQTSVLMQMQVRVSQIQRQPTPRTQRLQQTQDTQ